MGFSSTTALPGVYFREFAIAVIVVSALTVVGGLPRASAQNDFPINMLVTTTTTTIGARQNCTLEQTIVRWAVDVLWVVEARLEMDESPYHPWVRKCRLLASFYYSTLSASERLSVPWWVGVLVSGLYFAVEAY